MMKIVIKLPFIHTNYKKTSELQFTHLNIISVRKLYVYTIIWYHDNKHENVSWDNDFYTNNNVTGIEIEFFFFF